MSEPYYSVGEGDGSVEVCVDLSSLPAGGLECEISVTLDFNDGVKASKHYLMMITLPFSQYVY